MAPVTRADLLTACAAATGFDAWAAAVRALGQWRREQDAAPPKPRKHTGRDYWQTIFQITRSHHFTDSEREEYRRRAEWERGSDTLYAEVTGLAKERAKAERELKKTNN